MNGRRKEFSDDILEERNSKSDSVKYGYETSLTGITDSKSIRQSADH